MKGRRTDTWKKAELKLAALLLGERIPVTGRASGERADIGHGEFALEVKHGKQIPALLKKAMAQAVKAADFCFGKGEGSRIPVVLFHPEGARYEDTLVIVRIKDLPRLRREVPIDG